MNVNNKKIAIECMNEDQFRALEKFEGVEYGSPFSLMFNAIPLGDYGNGRNIERASFDDNYYIVPFNVFSQLTGVKVAEKPKEVIIEWQGISSDVLVTVKKSAIKFDFIKPILGFYLNKTQQKEILTALKSLEDHE